MELAAKKRVILGKKVKAFRREGFIPAELYGRGVENLHLILPAKDFKKILKEAGENTVIDVAVDGQPHKAMIHDMATDYLTGDILHVDLHQIRLDEKIRVHVPLEFAGIAPALKQGGVVVKAMQELEIEAMPMDIPKNIAVDLSVLQNIGDSIYVKNLPATANVKVLVNPETVVASVTEKMSEEKEEVQAAAIDVEAIKSETEEKKAEREAEKGEKTEKAPEAAPAAKK